MKHLFILTACYFTITSSTLATTLNSSDTSKTDALGKKQGLWKEIINGVDWYGNYLNNQKNGAWVNYHPGTTPPVVSQLESYVEGEKNGISLETDRVGYIIKQEYYANDTLNGIVSVYTNGNQLRSETTYVDGKLNGIKRLYNQENLKVQEEGMWVNNLREGLTKWYFNEGTVSIQYTYKKGILEGEMKTFFRNGNIDSKGTYKNNELEGEYVEFYEDGKPKTVGSYSKGKKTGTWKVYDENGKMKQVKN